MKRFCKCCGNIIEDNKDNIETNLKSEYCESCCINSYYINELYLSEMSEIGYKDIERFRKSIIRRWLVKKYIKFKVSQYTKWKKSTDFNIK